MIRFILNPVSGRKPVPPQEIKRYTDYFFPGSELCITQGPGHATTLAQEAAQKGYQAVVAIGGDGTINETAKGLVDTATALGIVARGSGNGFARELGLTGSLSRIFTKLHALHTQSCDVGFANGELFLNVAGVGLDAHIAWQFMQHGKTGTRGMWPYFKLAAKAFFAYKPSLLRVTLNGKTHRWAPLSLVFANNRQYGSRFIIAPQAAIADGKLDLVLLQDKPKYQLAAALPFFFLGQEPPFGVTAHAPIHSAVVESDREIVYHIDGEPRKTAHHLEITISPRALRLLVPPVK